jgi:anaerobic dimethyl sulfoxide reductase subunit B (iron-sulfur subunit)
MCIGCRYCVNACPYHNPQYIDNLMVVHKCNACIELRSAGEQPACVAACPMRTLEFGEFEELKQKYPYAVGSLPVLPDSAITTPSLLIAPRPVALETESWEFL